MLDLLSPREWTLGLAAWTAGRRIARLHPGEQDPFPRGTVIAALSLPDNYLWKTFFAVYLGQDEHGVHVLGPVDDARSIAMEPEAPGLLHWGHEHAAYDASRYREILLKQLP